MEFLTVGNAKQIASSQQSTEITIQCKKNLKIGTMKMSAMLWIHRIQCYGF